jgi:hypothetical protein
MNHDVQIRPYEVSDEDGVAALWSQVFPDPLPRNEPRRVIASKLAVQGELFLIAVLEGAVVGTAMGRSIPLRRKIEGSVAAAHRMR